MRDRPSASGNCHTKTYLSRTPSGPKSAAALTHMHPDQEDTHQMVLRWRDDPENTPIAVAAKQAATFSYGCDNAYSVDISWTSDRDHDSHEEDNL